MIDFETLIANLPAHKRALLAANNPLSFAQERLWFLEQLIGGGPTFNLPSALRLEGDLDVEALWASVQEIVRRHEILRTTFAAPDGQVMQLVHEEIDLRLPFVDLRPLGEEERQASARAAMDDEVQLPFDLIRGPLLRCRLLRLGDREHLFLVTMHHIVSDGWSMDVLIRELSTLYAAFAGGATSPLPPLPIQYLDFARWQREWLRGEALEAPLTYWTLQLAGAQPVLELPADRPRPKARTYGGARTSATLPVATTEGLRRLAKGTGVTLFTTLLTGFMTLLGRWTGQWDVVIGSPAANRTREDLEPLIGCFINLLALRVDLTDDPAFVEALKRVSRTVVDAQAHQDLPFERLVEELQPERNLQHAPVVQVVFTLLITPPQKGLRLPSLALIPLEMEAAGSQYDISLSAIDTADGLSVRLEYSTDLFEDATARRILGGFETLLAGVAQGDGLRPLSELPLLTDAERRQLLASWSSPAPVCPFALPVHRLFEQRVELSPDAEAARCGGESLSYRELERRAQRLARSLRRLGVGHETLVALCVERSLDMLVGLFGILKAGGAYLPLDPEHPKERLAWMLADSAAPVLVTQERLLAVLPGSNARILLLDAPEPGIAGEDEREDLPAAEELGNDPEHLAYVLYTSGSTGRPKAVQVTQRGVVNFVTAMAGELGLGERETLLAVTTLSFDISVLELILPLLGGGRVVVAGPGVAADGRRLAELLDRSGATAMQATPATWQMLIESGWRGDAGLKLFCGGEALPLEVARQLLARGAGLWNLYGPTETTVWSSVHRVRAQEPGPVPLGHPLAATDLRILGPGCGLQPAGVAGELCIGGAGVARGYRDRPDLTAERFVPDPWGSLGARLYRTGDLARFRADGELDFLGRIDHQVKLRGFRLELGEIEESLLRHPEVLEVAVRLWANPSRDPLLVAYVVPSEAHPDLPAALRRFLEERLPGYMVPAFFVTLDALPLTASGKVDRRALPAPDPVGLGGVSQVAPRTPLETEVAEIWSHVLGLQEVGVETSFFELGGHSLSAARVIHRLRATLQVDLPLAQFFETPTVAGLAAAIARRRAGPAAQVGDLHRLPPIVPDPERRHDPFPLNDVQQAYWIGRGSFFALGNVASHSYTEIEMTDLDLERLTRALRRLIERHDMLRAIVMPDGMQRILPEVPPYEVETLDLRQRQEEEVAAALAAVRETMSHQVRPTDRWPLFEVRASRLENRRSRLHFSLDFLIADAWSVGIIFDEVFRLYTEPELELAPLGLSFRDWVLAEKGLEQGDLYRRAEEYWRGRLAALPPAPALPLARNPQTLERPRFVRRTSTLAPEVWQVLQRRAMRFGLTPSGLLLAAFSEVLARWSKSPCFTLNITLFNRPLLHPQIEEVVGDFTTLNLLAVDLVLPGTFVLRARRIQEQLWQDMEHQAVGAIRVLREMAHAEGRAPDTVMPVVFTSALGQRRRLAGTDRDRESAQVYGISQTPQVWLDHQVVERDGALVFNWDVVEDLFSPGLLDDAFATYCGFLDELVEKEDWESLARPSLPAAQAEVLRCANATETPLPGGLLHTLFTACAAAQPDLPAVIAPDLTLSYGELDALSNRLAHRLRRSGVRTNELVALVMEKGWEQIVGALAVLKAGAAYLPIDPSLPQKRRALLLEQGGARIALVQPWIESGVEWPVTVERVRVEVALPDDLSAEPLAPVQCPGDLAYVIYTSGSTGTPKGVMIDHRGAVNTILDVNQRFGVGPLDRVFALSAFNFDLSVYDVFGLLAAGGTVVLPAESRLLDPGSWGELIEHHRVTLWNSVPALLEMLLLNEEANNAGRLRSLRVAMLSGDWLPVSLPDRLRGLAEAVEVVSMGGATEASIWSILYPIGAVDPAWRSIPYGRAMLNQTFHVLDANLEPRPFWVPGELFIGGIGLALGYWRDEERTNERFFVHPRTGERLYRTGDLGRWLPDGNIEFLGREDFQVKIRGHRIELGEIEAALQQVREVQSAVVSVAGSGQEDRRLVAYVVLRQPAAGEEEPAAEAAAAPPRLADAVAKLDFKLQELGLRRDLGDRRAIDLPRPDLDEAGLDRFRSRRSQREFSPQPISSGAFGRALACLAEEPGFWGEGPRRHHLTSGAAPRAFVWVKPGRVAEVAAGLYRYHPADHRLERIAGLDLRLDAYDPVNRLIAEQAAFALFLVGSGEDAVGTTRDAALVEAGCVGQLLMEETPASSVGFCPIGTVDLRDSGLDGLLGLGGGQDLLHSFLGGLVDPSRGEVDWQEPAEGTAAPVVELGWGGAYGDSPGRYEYRNPGDFLAAPLAFEALHRFLGCLRQVRLPEFPLPKYRYPSAGNLYPVQVYVHVRRGGVEGVAPGAYYYDPKAHRLVQVAPEGGLADALYAAVDRPSWDGSAFSLLLVSRLDAIAPVYGELAPDFCALEAGYLTQLLGVAAAELDLGLWPLTLPVPSDCQRLLGLEERQAVLGCLAGGAVSAERFDALAQMDLSAPASFFAGIAAVAAPPPPATGTMAPSRHLREVLAESLPDYMIPAQFVFVESLPLTANGKVDRKALPEPDTWKDESAPEFVAPRGELEKLLTQIWGEVLGRADLGVNDSFFSLGGNSLHLVRIHTQLQARLERELPITDFFKYPTIATLAKALGGEVAEDQASLGEIQILAQKQKEALRQKGIARRRLEDHG